MNTIKFSHRYTKMPQDLRETELLEVFIGRGEDLHQSFVNYDTFYSKGFYFLPKGKIIILLLRTINYNYPNQIWTTIRRWTQEKEAYYKGLRGQQVNIEVSKE